jgi:uncharacterized protein YciI
MNTRSFPLLARSAWGCLAAVSLWAADPPPLPVPASATNPPPSAVATKSRQFLGILRLAPRYHDAAAMTPDAQAAIGRHFQRLLAAARSGQVLLAGRTDEPNDKTLGLVVFEAADAAEAERFMAEDPAVVAGVMLPEVRPYQVALMRSKAPADEGRPSGK